MLYAIDRNILKYHRFLHHEIEKRDKKKETFRQRIRFLEKSEFSGIVSFLRVRD